MLANSKQSTTQVSYIILLSFFSFSLSVTALPNSNSGFAKIHRRPHRHFDIPVISLNLNNTAPPALTTIKKRATPLLPIDLADAGAFTLLAESRLTSIAASTIIGDVGISPAAASYITGGFNPLAIVAGDVYATSPEVSGFVYSASYPAGAAKVSAAVVSARAAYTSAATAPDPLSINIGGGNLGGMNLGPGIYKFDTAVNINGMLTLTGLCTDVFIFQISAVLSTGVESSVVLTGGLMSGTVYWQIAGGIQTGAASSFSGIILSQTTVVLSGSFTGRAYAGTSIDLQMVRVTPPGECPVISSLVSSAQDVATTALAVISSTAVPFTTNLLNQLPSATTPGTVETGAANGKGALGNSPATTPIATKSTGSNPPPEASPVVVPVNDAKVLGSAAAKLQAPASQATDADPGAGAASDLATFINSESSTSQPTMFTTAIPQPTSTSNVPVTITVVPAEQQPQPTVYNSGTSKVSPGSVVSIVGAGLLLTLFLS